MPFTFRPSVGADVILAHSTLELSSIDLYNEGGTAISLTRSLGGAQYQYLPSGSLDMFDGTAGSDTIFGSSAAGTRDLFLWHPGTATQVGVPAELLTPFSNNAATSIDVVLMGAGDDILSLSNSTTVLGNPGTYTLSMTGYGGTGSDILWMAAGNDAVFGDEDNDLIGGQGGNDTLYGGVGTDSIFGGLGEDRAYGGGDDDIIQGDAGNDTMYGMAGGDTLYGGADSDFVFGGALSDTLYGDAGTDTLYGGTEQDTLFGGADGDVLYGEASNDVLHGDAGTDTLYGGDLQDTIYGGTEGDAVYGDAGDDSIYGDGGNDTLTGGTGRDLLYGGVAADLLVFEADSTITQVFQVAISTGESPTFSLALPSGSNYAWSTDLFDGGGGLDTLQLTAGNDLILMNTQDLIINGVGQSGNGAQLVLVDVIDGDAGNDIILVNDAAGNTPLATSIILIGGAGQDLLVAGAGSDVLVGGLYTGTLAGGDRDTMYGGGGNDIIYGESTTDDPIGTTNGGFDTIFGGSGADLIFAGADTDTVYGGNDGDTLYGGAGVDRIFADGGADTAYGDADGDSLSGDAGNDTLYGGFGSDTLIGGADNDALYGEVDLDSLSGGTGNDTLYGGGRADTLDGGEGTDLLFGDDGADTLNFSQDATIAAAGDSGVSFWSGEGVVATGTHLFASDISRSFDTYDGGGDTDILVGNNGANLLVNNSGDIFINGVAQASRPDHLAGIEVFEMGGGADVVVLNDRTEQETWTSSVTIFGGSLNDLIVSGSGDDRLAGGNPTGEAAADVFDTDTIFGGGGDDVIFGDRENRETSGEGGNDTLYGGTGSDTLFGDAGADRLFGGRGQDILRGGVGDDLLFANRDIDIAVPTTVMGWDGGGEIIEVTLASGTQATNDQFVGGDGFDTVDLSAMSTLNARTYFGVPTGVAFGSFLSGVELIIAGAASDVINLTDAREEEPLSAYGSDITIIAGGAADTVISGSGSDTIYGDFRAGTVSTTEGDDVLFGGSGNDIIYADSVDGHEDGSRTGDDTVYGGGGADTLFGGDGDDILSDLTDGGQLWGGSGSDELYLGLSSVNGEGQAVGGGESPDDGDDRVFVSGYYAFVTSDLGAGNDVFISNADGDNGEGNSGARADQVEGGTGDDVISTWAGNDTIYGGEGSDALWGGESEGYVEDNTPGDFLYGGAGIDYLYGGTGNNDQLYGGAGVDYYYWGRGDSMGDQVYDEFRGTDLDGQAGNYLIVFPGDDGAGNMPAGFGVFETDGSITDNDGDDMVHAYDLDGAGDGTMWRLEILQGDGTGNYVEFDQRDIQYIGLWNNDAAPGTQVITGYQWNGETYVAI